MIGTPENPDIVDYLRAGIDNADKGSDGVRELGGVVLTMNQAADEIIRLRVQIESLMAMLAAAELRSGSNRKSYFLEEFTKV